jgi:hypothetical protein
LSIEGDQPSPGKAGRLVDFGSNLSLFLSLRRTVWSVKIDLALPISS